VRCRAIQPELPDFVRGRMEPDAMLRISEHLTGCRQCSEDARGMKELLGMIETKSWVPPEHYWQSILPRVHRNIEERSRSVLPLWTTRFALPLAAALLLAVVSLRISPRPGEDVPETFSTILRQLTPEELQEVSDQQAVAEILHPDLAANEQSLSSVDDLEDVKAILREDGGGTTYVDAEVATGMEDEGTEDAEPALQQRDSLN